MYKIFRHFKKHGILWTNFFGVIFGVGLGFGLRVVSPQKITMSWIGLPGNLLLSFLEMVIVPISVSSIIVGTSSVSLQNHKIVLTVLLSLVTLTNMLSTTVGLSLGYFLTKGNLSMATLERSSRPGNGTNTIFTDILRNIVPRSLVRASFQSVRTLDSDLVSNKVIWNDYQVIHTNVPNMMGLVCMSLLIGIVAAYKKEEAKTFIDFLRGVMTIGFALMGIVTWVSPLCLASLTTVSIFEVDDIRDVFIQLVIFASLQTGANMIYQLVILPALVFSVNAISCANREKPTRNPLKIMRVSLKSWLITFATASPAIALPDIYDISKVLGVCDDVINTGVPLAFTMTTSGCGIYVGMASLFLAEASQIALTTTDTIIIGITIITSTVSFGTVPSGSIVGLIMVTTSMGIPNVHLGLLIAVEWIVDRVRSTTSVMTTIVCVYLADRLTSHKLSIQKFREGVNIQNIYISKL